MKRTFTTVIKTKLFVAFSLLLVGLGQVGFAQSTWTGTTSGAWLTAGNWSPSGAPAGGTAIAFINNNTQPTMGINMNSITGTNNPIGAFHFGASATTARTINNSSTTVAGTFTLNGITINSVANTIIRTISGTTHTITNGSSQALNIGLGNATNNVIAIDGAGGLTINSNITGSGRNLTKVGTGAGILQLTGANTYSGTTTVSGGTMQLNRTGGTTIPVGNSVVVNNGATLLISTAQQLNNVTVDAGGTLIVAATLTITGTATINGNFQINQGGFATGGTWTYGSTGTLIFNNTSGAYGVNGTPSYWPATNGPTNVTVQGGGGINMGVARTVSGTFLLVSGTNAIQGTALTLNGTTQINGGNFQTTPTYGSSSTLVYNTTYGTSNEWTGGATTSVAAGSGVPANVQVLSGTLTLAGGRGVPGNVTVTAGGLTLNATSGDLYLGGNLSNSGTWTNNSRAVVFAGTGTSTITASSGTQFFDYLLVSKSSGSVQISSATNVTINTTVGSVLQFLNAGSLDLNGRTLTLNGNGGNILADGATGGTTKNITSSALGGTIAITNNKTASGSNGGTLVIGTDVTVLLTNGMNFGGVTTINGNLQINGGGFVTTNAPSYGSSSTLVYNSGTTYGRGLEWSTTSGAGYPANVLIGNGNNTTLDLGNGGTGTARQISGNLTVASGSTFSMNVNVMTAALTVLGNVVNNGTMTLSGSIGGDLRLQGNLTDNGTFNANNRAIFFDASNVQDIQGSGTFDIAYVRINKAGGRVRLLSNLTCQGPNGGNAMEIAGTSSILDLNGFTLFLGQAGVNSTYNNSISPAGYIRGSSTSNLTILGNGTLGTIVFDPSSPGTTDALNNVTIDRQSTGVVTLGSNVNINGALALTNGIVTMGSNTLVITSTGSVTRTAGWINGNLQKNVVAGTSIARSFEIGNSTVYTPVSLTFSTVSAAGDLLVTTTSPLSLQPNLASLDLDATVAIDRYFTLSNVNTLAFDSYEGTFHFNAADIIGGANTSNLKVGVYGGSSWTYPTVGTLNSTNSSAIGITTLGDVVLATCKNPTLYAVTGGGTICPGGTGVSVGLANSETGVTYQLQVDLVNTGSPIAGTGSALDFGLQTTLGNYTVVATITSTGCSTTMTGSATVSLVASNNWIGNSSINWSDGANWSCGVAPTSAIDAVINTGGTYQPSLSIGTGSVKSITINSGATVTVSGSATLQIAGSITNNGTFDATAGTIELNGTTAQNIAGSNFSSSSLAGLTISNNSGVNIASTANDYLYVTDVLNFGGSTTGAVLNTGDNLVLTSTTSGTARVDQVINGNSITGRATVQRYIPAPNRRAWRLITAPVSSSNDIYDSWQNGGVYDIGKGTHVTGPGATGGAGNGLDISVQNNTSMRGWNPAGAGSFANVSNTHTPVSAGTNGSGQANNTGYFLFVRGDRNPDHIVPFTTSTNNTILSANGTLQYGQQDFTNLSNTSGGFSLIGNPYFSPVDFNLVLANTGTTNLERKFYAWDPRNLSGTVGGYVSMSEDILGDGVFLPSPDNSTQNNIIQSSQAIFVVTAADGAASMQFQESNKVAGSGGVFIFRPASPTATIPAFRTNLLYVNADNSTTFTDGNVAKFDNSYCGCVDSRDDIKLTNVNETVGLLRTGVVLSTERRPLIVGADTLYIHLNRTTQRNYQFVFAPTAMAQPGLTARLIDAYTNSSTLLSLTDSSRVNFSINADLASQSATRFKVVFDFGVVLPVTFRQVQATKLNSQVVVDWKVENELNIARYEVESSVDGNRFALVNTTSALGNGNHAYQWIDQQPVAGDNFYRVRSIDVTGRVSYSQIVKVNFSKGKLGIAVYPNPSNGNTIGLQINDMPVGVYDVQLYNTAGQLLYGNRLSHTGGSSINQLVPTKVLAAGQYQLKVSATGMTTKVIQVLVQR